MVWSWENGTLQPVVVGVGVWWADDGVHGDGGSMRLGFGGEEIHTVLPFHAVEGCAR